ncbi:MAG TPA: hypothetical protein VFS43_42300 [Polyangiaceae bacterium]|nr:hypothetical protein [Polyangiaceae bacterium]
MLASLRHRPRSLTRTAAPLLVGLLLAACWRRPVVTRPSDDAAPSARRATVTAWASGTPSLAGLPAGAAEPGPRDGHLRAARDAVACKAEAPRGRTLVLDPRDATTGCGVVLSEAARDALVAAAFPGGRAACARLPCDEPSGQAGATAVRGLDYASAVRGAFTTPGRDQIAWALVAQAEGLPAAFSLTTVLVTEGDAVVARAEPEALSHGTFALVKALDADGDGLDEVVTRTSTGWMGEGRVDAALVGVRAGKPVELATFDDLLVERTGLGAEGEADTATRLFLVPAGAAGPAAFETEPFTRRCHPADAPSVRPAAKPCAGDPTDWRRSGPMGRVSASWAHAAGPGAGTASPLPPTAGSPSLQR